jgi:hypothetical protein
MSAIQWRTEMDNEAIERARLNLQRQEEESKDGFETDYHNPLIQSL